MKLIIAGSREGPSWDNAVTAFQEWPGPEATEIVSGGARGADKLGEKIAKVWELPCTIMPANWDEFGKAAGYIRNVQMAEYADCLLALWDGKSKGTQNMIELMKKKNKIVHVFYV